MDNDIESRWRDYLDRLNTDHIKAEIILRKNIALINKITGRDTIGHQQIRKLAYLLGYDDGEYCYPPDGPTGISNNTYRRIIMPLIPSESIISLGGLDISPGIKKYLKEVVMISGAENAIVGLDSLGKLFYSPDRFIDVLKKVC